MGRRLFRYGPEEKINETYHAIEYNCLKFDQPAEQIRVKSSIAAKRSIFHLRGLDLQLGQVPHFIF